MPSLNKQILLGHLGRDPEIKFTQSGKAVTNFSLATSNKWKDKAGNWQEEVEWHNIVAWGKLAEIAGEYYKKGYLVYVEGSKKTRTYDDKDGGKKYVVETVATLMKNFTPKNDQPNDDIDPELGF